MTTRQRSHPRRLQPLHAWLLAALLLAAQALGLAHRVAHAPGLPAAPAQATVFAVADVHAHADAEASAHAQHEAGSADCRLIDQLAHADALCGDASLPPALLRADTLGTLANVPALPLKSSRASGRRKK